MTTATASPTWLTLSVASWAPVSTSTTPGILFAAPTSMALILARACGERTKKARVAPGLVTSSVYWPLPVMKRMSSLRRTAAPIPVALMAVSSRWLLLKTLLGGLPRRTSSAHGFGAGGNGFDDVVVARAAADIAVELLADGLLVEVVALAAHDIERGHDHARRAIAALQAVVLADGRRHRR